jgi:hypothetical protein
LFGAALKLIAAARHHRVERELRIGGPRHDTSDQPRLAHLPVYR